MFFEKQFVTLQRDARIYFVTHAWRNQNESAWIFQSIQLGRHSGKVQNTKSPDKVSVYIKLDRKMLPIKRLSFGHVVHSHF